MSTQRLLVSDNLFLLTSANSSFFYFWWIMHSILEIWYAEAETVITESLHGALWDDALTVKHSVLSISLHQYLAGHLCSFNVSEYKLDKVTNIKLELLCICNWQILLWKHAWTWGSNLAFNIYISFQWGSVWSTSNLPVVDFLILS